MDGSANQGDDERGALQFLCTIRVARPSGGAGGKEELLFESQGGGSWTWLGAAMGTYVDGDDAVVDEHSRRHAGGHETSFEQALGGHRAKGDGTARGDAGDCGALGKRGAEQEQGQATTACAGPAIFMSINERHVRQLIKHHLTHTWLTHGTHPR